MNASPQIVMNSKELDKELDTVFATSKPNMRDHHRVSKPGGSSVAIRIHFEVEGSGDFRAGKFDTSNGTRSAWLKPQTVLNLNSKPGPGFRFSHWVINNDFSGSNRTRRAIATRGMVIKAVFQPLTSEDIRS